jgi:hypothetical protein
MPCAAYSIVKVPDARRLMPSGAAPVPEPVLRAFAQCGGVDSNHTYIGKDHRLLPLLHNDAPG